MVSNTAIALGAAAAAAGAGVVLGYIPLPGAPDGGRWIAAEVVPPPPPPPTPVAAAAPAVVAAAAAAVAAPIVAIAAALPTRARFSISSAVTVAAGSVASVPADDPTYRSDARYEARPISVQLRPPTNQAGISLNNSLGVGLGPSASPPAPASRRSSASSLLGSVVTGPLDKTSRRLPPTTFSTMSLDLRGPVAMVASGLPPGTSLPAYDPSAVASSVIGGGYDLPAVLASPAEVMAAASAFFAS